jgi:hypothetical protein
LLFQHRVDLLQLMINSQNSKDTESHKGNQGCFTVYRYGGSEGGACSGNQNQFPGREAFLQNFRKICTLNTASKGLSLFPSLSVSLPLSSFSPSLISFSSCLSLFLCLCLSLSLSLSLSGQFKATNDFTPICKINEYFIFLEKGNRLIPACQGKYVYAYI